LTDPAVNPLKDYIDRYANDPVLWVRESFGVDPYPDQIEMLEAYRRGDRRIAKRSGHGVGKTTALAWIIDHHAIFKFPQKTVCTAPTGKQLFKALYAEVVTWIRKLPQPIQDLFEIKAEDIVLRAAPTESFISFHTSSADKPEALAGVHSDNVLLIVDEASGIHETVFEAASGSMSGHNATTILAGNPVRRTGTFYNVFHKPAMMQTWTRMHVSCVGHPNVTPDFIKQIADQYGESSNAYRVRVLGEFPRVDDDTVISWEMLDGALKRDVKPLMVRPVWGLDVARKGRDACALAKRKGNALLEPVREWRGKDTMQTVGIVKREWDMTLPSDRPSEIMVDAIGEGSGVADRLQQLGLPARRINVSESASMDDKFRNLRSELWWKGREWFQRKDCAIHGTGFWWNPSQARWEREEGAEWQEDFLAAELGRPTFDYTDNGKIIVEAKKQTMKRTQEDSPNRADAFLLTLASEAVTAAGTDGRNTVGWNQPLQREIKGIV
jgi:phage terminase large subunit